MNNESFNRKLNSGVGCCLLSCASVLFGCGQDSHVRTSQQTELAHFDGVIDNSDTTQDSTLSGLYVRASHFLENGDIDAAKVLYKKAIVKYPNDPKGYSALGACFYFEEKFDKANAQYLRALELDTNCASAHYGLGCVAYEQQNLEDGVKHLSKALEIDPNDSDTHRTIGMVYAARGDLTQARIHYMRAIELNESDDLARKLLKRIKQK